MTSSVLRLKSWTCYGLEDRLVEVEVLRSRGLQQLSLTGLPGPWLRDSRDKIRSLTAHTGTWGPLDRLLVHLLPSEESKAGAHLELPIVLACRLALEPELPASTLEKIRRYSFVGSLGLDGSLRPTEATSILEELYGDQLLGPRRFADLEQVWGFLLDPEAELPPPRDDASTNSLAEFTQSRTPGDVATIGFRFERTVLAAAAVERLPVLLSGPPGIGKSHLARWSHGLLPPPESFERSLLRRVWALASMPAPDVPFLTPGSRTHAAELVGINRGGMPRPGFFALAHGGLLVLDEFVELARDSRETLRTILDTREILRHGAQGSVRWPADFWLIATINPCPCGFYGSSRQDCVCSRQVRDAYSARLSGPLFDRFALRLTLRETNPDPRSHPLLRRAGRNATSETASELEFETEFDPDAPMAERQKRIAEARDRLKTADFARAESDVERLLPPSASRRERRQKARILAALRALGAGEGSDTALLAWMLVQERGQITREASRVVRLSPRA